jgi:hypothetical protein
MDKKVTTGKRALEFQKNPRSSLRQQLVQRTQMRGTGKGPIPFVSNPRSLTQTPKRIKAKPPAAKPASAAKQVSSSRQAATDRLKIKTQVRRAKSADRGSVVTPGQRSRLETGKGKTTKATKPQSTLAKPRTKGNTKQQVASRVERKLGAERVKMDRLNRVERTGARQGNQRERSYKRQMTLERAQNFLKSGKLPGKDNSIAAQRSTKQARQRLAAKNVARKQAAAKPAATPKAAKPKGKAKIDDNKVSRVISRVNKVVRGSEGKTGVKRLNAIQVGARAKSFLARKEGGNAGILNQKSQPEAFSSVRKAMTKPPRYSTQKPNRNKPGRFNDLGQDKLRAKAKTDAMTGRERIAKANESAAVKAKERKGKIPTGTMSRRSLPQLGAPRAPGYVKGPQQAGTMAKPKTSSTPVSSTVARTRIKAKAAQRNRREQILDRARTGVTGLGNMKKNPRIKRIDTGMRQLSLTGKAKTLYKFKSIKRR